MGYFGERRPKGDEEIDCYGRPFGVNPHEIVIVFIVSPHPGPFIKLINGPELYNLLLLKLGLHAVHPGRGNPRIAANEWHFFKDKNVVTVGGGSSGVQESLYLTRFVKSIQLVEFMDRLSAEKILQKRALDNPKFSFFLNHRVVSINGTRKVESVTVTDNKTGESRDLGADGVFVWVGLKPNTEFLRGKIKLDPNGAVVTDSEMATSVPGVFAAGDVRSKTVRQITTAVGDATTAAESALRYLESLER